MDKVLDHLFYNEKLGVGTRQHLFQKFKRNTLNLEQKIYKLI